MLIRHGSTGRAPEAREGGAGLPVAPWDNRGAIWRLAPVNGARVYWPCPRGKGGGGGLPVAPWDNRGDIWRLAPVNPSTGPVNGARKPMGHVTPGIRTKGLCRTDPASEPNFDSAISLFSVHVVVLTFF